jgi:hypothetical protein
MPAVAARANTEPGLTSGNRVSSISVGCTVVRSPQSIVAIALVPSASAKAPLPPAAHS